MNFSSQEVSKFTDTILIKNKNGKEIQKTEFNTIDIELKHIDEVLKEEEPINKKFLQHIKQFWQPYEIRPEEDDMACYPLLDDETKIIIQSILVFFLFADKMVLNNLEKINKNSKLYRTATYFINTQMFMESIHDQSYMLLGRSYYNNPIKFEKDYNLLENMITITKNNPDEEFDFDNFKCEWYEAKSEEEKRLFKAVSLKINLLARWGEVDSPLYNLVLTFIIESIGFSALFAIIGVYKANITGLKYLNDVNEFVLLDEKLHADFWIMFYRDYITNKLDKEILKKLILEISQVEMDFLNSLLPNGFNIYGVKTEDFNDYTKLLCNQIWNTLGYEGVIYDIQLSALKSQITQIYLQPKTNMFERIKTYAHDRISTSYDDLISKF